MMRGALTVLTLISVCVFPWPLSVLLALLAAPLEPLVPLAAGILADTLYFAPQTASFPLFALLGAVATVATFFVRSRLNTGSIGG